jgi:predicted permease
MRYAVRQLVKNPGFTIIALATLALGIGVNTTAFTVLNRLMLQSLPFRDPSTLVQIRSGTNRDGFRMGTAPADYFDERDQNEVFEDVAAYQPGLNMSYAETGKAPIQVGAVYMTANFLPILGVLPQLGRTPTEEESKTMAHVCLIGDSFWRQHFNADPNVLGQTIRVNSRPSTVIGVVPPSLDDPSLFGTRPNIFYLDPVTHSRGVRNVGWYTVLARMKPGVALAQAQAGMTVVAKRLAKQYPDTNKDREFKVVRYPTSRLDDASAQLTWMTLALSCLVLLIACINLANLQIVRTTGRAHEIAIRLSLGSPRWRLIGLFLVESVLVSVVGGALGMVVAAWSNAYVARFFEVDMPIDLRVVAFAFLVSLGTAVLFGTAPAWLATRAAAGLNLKTGNRGSTSDRSRHWLRQGLVLAELAIALTLLAGAGFFISGLYRLTHRTLGWDPSHEIVGVISLDQDHFGGEKNKARVQAFGNEALAALRALPGVRYAALSNGSPSWGVRTIPYRVEGQPPPEKGREPLAGYASASPGWFDVFAMRLVEGRAFTEADRTDSKPVAIVSEAMAHKLWPGKSAIGKRFAEAGEGKPAWAEVVGVMGDFKGIGDFYNPAASSIRFLRPWTQDPPPNGNVLFAVRTSGPPGPFVESVRKAMGILLPDLALNYLATIDEDVAGTYSYFTFLRRVLVQIAALGLLLSAVGIYGVVANLVTERTKEIGIRMALGAQPGSILWMFVRNGLILACIGVALGLLGAFGLDLALARIVPSLPGNNPRVVAGAAIALVAVAVLACWLPARRTTRISPMRALRVD